MRLTKSILAVCMVSMLAYSCEGQKEEEKNEKPEKVEQTVEVKLLLLSPDDAEKKLQEEDVQLVDVRTPEEYAEGHIEGAVNINYNGDNFKEELSKLDKGKPVMVYCAHGRRSGASAEIAEELGFSTIYDIDGGFAEWEAAGKPKK